MRHAAASRRASTAVSSESASSGSSSAVAKRGEQDIVWTHPGPNLSRLPEEVVYALPPTYPAPFPQTAAEKRRKFLRSWAPGVAVVVIAGTWYVSRLIWPSQHKPEDWLAVPAILRNTPLNSRMERVTAPVATAPATPQGPAQGGATERK